MPNKRDSSEPVLRFNAFLSHNSKNKPAVRDLKERLVAARLRVWFDEDELRPGIPWQELLEAGIKASKSVVVLVGADGFGPWEDEEMQGALRLAIKERRPVIPVLLPGCPEAPDLPLFLGNRTWVDLRTGLTNEGFNKLLWGITGVKPRQRANSASDATPPVLDQEVEREEENEELPDSQPAPPSLNQLLPGTWQVQIQLPFPPGVMGQLQLELFPNGLFRGQLIGPMGVTAVEGQWQANPLTNQIGLQGMQSNGFQTIPYIVLVQVTGFNPQQIVGVTSAGERVAWQRTSPPAVPPPLPPS
jgi:hypothetical protein